jgi:hypothetical protein
MTTTAVATPKIVGKAIYLELVGNDTIPEDELRQLLGWQHKGTKQIILFPEYQDDTGKVWGAVVMERLISSHSPKAQWDFTYIDRLRTKPAENNDSNDHYVNYNNYSNAEWADLTEREKFEARKRGLEVVLRNQVISTTYTERDSEGNRGTIAKQGWVVREGKPISVELTDEDLNDLHLKSKTPQAVIRRINKVRETLDKFPAKLA